MLVVHRFNFTYLFIYAFYIILVALFVLFVLVLLHFSQSSVSGSETLKKPAACRWLHHSDQPPLAQAMGEEGQSLLVITGLLLAIIILLLGHRQANYHVRFRPKTNIFALQATRPTDRPAFFCGSLYFIAIIFF